MKNSKAVKIVKSFVNLIAIGSKGIVGVIGKIPEALKAKVNTGEQFNLTWPNFKQYASRETLINMHAAGKPMADIHYSLAAFDLGCYCTAQGGKIALYTQDYAEKRGLIKAVKMTGEKNGSFVGYLPAKWTSAEKLPHYVYVPSLPAKRVEPRQIDGGSNSAVADHVKLANAKPAKVAPSKPNKPIAKVTRKTIKSALKNAIKAK